jgi:hypothetical protein
MRKWLRPLLLTCLVSFLLGIWFSLQKAENHILSRLKSLPKVVLLTDHPEWWGPLADSARKQAVFDLEISSPSRTEWEAVIKGANGGCHLVAIKSLFENYFAGNEIIAPFPDELASHWDQVHPDFRLKTIRQKRYFLPLAWSVSRWRAAEGTPGPLARLQIKTSPDEALLAAYDLNLVGSAETEDEESDWSTLAESAWEQFKGKAFFDLTGAETTVPTYPVKGTLEYISEEPADPPPSDVPTGTESNLWTYGLSLCRGQLPPQTLARVLFWLMEPEQLSLFLKTSRLSGALSSLEHGGIPETQRPSALRRFSLAKLRQRELSWPVAAAWHEIFFDGSRD